MCANRVCSSGSKTRPVLKTYQSPPPPPAVMILYNKKEQSMRGDRSRHEAGGVAIFLYGGRIKVEIFSVSFFFFLMNESPAVTQMNTGKR